MAPGEKRVAPAHLSEASKKLWEQILEEYEIDAAAEPMLLSFLEAMERREQARLAMRETGPVIKDRFNVDKISPWAAVERDSTLVMQRAWRLLGFDQQARGGSADQGKLFG